MILKRLKKFDKKISISIFNLRNKPYVRNNSFNKKLINFKDHTKWIRNFLKKKNIIYLIIKDKKFIGYIRLEYKKKIYNVSWALNKKYHAKGIIKKSLVKATNNKKYVYYAIVKKNNIASIKVAKHASFELDKTKNQICHFYKNKY